MSLDQPPKPPQTDDAFAEFPSEPVKPEEVQKERDWFAEFPDEKEAHVHIPRAKNWMQLNERVKNEKP